jgi:hypothetical protein
MSHLLTGRLRTERGCDMTLSHRCTVTASQARHPARVATDARLHGRGSSDSPPGGGRSDRQVRTPARGILHHQDAQW